MTAPPESIPSWPRRHRRHLMMAAQILALVLVTWLLVIPQLRGSAHSLNLLFRTGSGWIVLALVAELMSLISYSLVTRVMIPRTTRPPIQRVVGIDLSAIAVGHCLPDGGAAGTALSWRLLVAEGVPVAEAGFAKIAQGLGSTVVLQALLLGAYAIGTMSAGFSQWEVLPAAFAAGILLISVLVVIGIRNAQVRRLGARGVRLIPWCGPRLAGILANIYRRHLIEQMRSTVGTNRTLLLASAAIAANWAFDALALWAAIRAYGPNTGIEALAVAFGIQALGAWLPITPSGLGVSEAAMIPALIAFGGARSAIVLGILTWRVISYWLPIPIGAVAYTTLRISHGRRLRVSQLQGPEREVLDPGTVAPAVPVLADVGAGGRG